jgi:hypothetical protein
MVEQLSRAERFAGRRGKVCLMFSLVSVCWTVVLIAQVTDGKVRELNVLVWALWLLVPMVWAFGLPGWWRWAERDRAIINDELALEHQRHAAVAAMLVLVLCLFAGCLQLLGYFSLPAWWPIAAMGAGVCVAGLRFGWLQVRASE